MVEPRIYVGLFQDSHGLTQLGRIVIDAWVFGLLPEDVDCSGWDMGRMQALMEKVDAEWDKYGNLPSRLPPELRERHAALYARFMEEARRRGWNPELDDENE